jgi:hypothetical protein
MSRCSTNPVYATTLLHALLVLTDLGVTR